MPPTCRWIPNTPPPASIGSSEARGWQRSSLRRRWNTFYDESGNIGRRYRRQDEAGTPFCVTVDFDTAEDGQVTLRDRDSMQQERVSADRLHQILAEKLEPAP